MLLSDSQPIDHEQQVLLNSGMTSMEVARVSDVNTTKKKSSKWQELLLTSATIKLPLVSAGVYSFVSVAKNVSFFPFLRTTIVCVSNITAITDTSSEKWSGSSYCTDLDLVAREGQFIKGLSEGLDQTVHCLALPLLGHAIDCYGRRWGVLCGMTGIFLQCFFYFLATSFLDASHLLIIIGSIIQGGTGVFMTAINASIRDIQLKNVGDENSPHASQAFGAIQISQGSANVVAVIITTVFIISHNLTSYQAVWGIFSCVSLLVLLMCYYFYGETHDSLQQWQWRKASPFNVLVLFRESESHKWIGLGVFFVTFALTSFSVLQAFTIREFKWTQTYSTSIFLILSPCAVVSLAASFTLIPRYGPVWVLRINFYLMNFCMICFSLAKWSEAFVFLGISSLLLSIGAFPALMQVITSTCEEHRTGEVLANIGAVCLGAVAIGNLVYGTIFSHKFISTMSFFVGTPLMWIGTYCASRAREHVEHIS